MPDILDQLSGADDSTLMEKLGLNEKLASAKDTLGKLASLPAGKPREQAVKRVEDMLAPNFYPGELDYIYERATEKPKDNGPSDMVSDVADVPDED